jgi:hypothetical protein
LAAEGVEILFDRYVLSPAIAGLGHADAREALECGASSAALFRFR